MRKLVSHLIITLDWVVTFGPVLEAIKKLRDTQEVLSDFFTRVAEEDSMLLGRVTYQQWADYWPNSHVEPFATHINTVPKYVVSQTLQSAPWGTFGNTTLLRGDLATDITALKRRSGNNIGVHGSPKLVESLIERDLLDELRLEIYPVIAGSGTHLFHEDRSVKHLQLVNSKTTNNGVVILSYKPASAL
jgi:dihydrofolate reductase